MKLAFLFPGQGAQAPGMGRGLADGFAAARATFDAADARLGFPLSELCFGGSAEQLALTENTQPAILTVSVAAWRALAERGIEPLAAAGHSLGEYSAHVAAGTIGFEDALAAVRERGRFMQDAVPVGTGAMAAVLGLEPDAVAEICARVAGEQVVAAANLNAPGQIVIAGHAEAVGRAVSACREEGARRAVPLDVSAPFHCELMRPAAERLRPVLEGIDFADPRVPVYTNVDAAPVTRGGEAREALLRQVAAPVRWSELMRRMLDDGFDTFVEVGPGSVLSGLLRRIERGARCVSVSDVETLERAVEELEGDS